MGNYHTGFKGFSPKRSNRCCWMVKMRFGRYSSIIILTRNSILGRLYLRRCCFLRTDHRLSTIPFEWMIGSFGEIARAQIVHLSGRYQFFQRYSQAQDSPRSRQKSYISWVEITHISRGSSRATASASRHPLWINGWWSRWIMRIAMILVLCSFSRTQIFFDLPKSVIRFSRPSPCKCGCFFRTPSLNKSSECWLIRPTHPLSVRKSAFQPRSVSGSL